MTEFYISSQVDQWDIWTATVSAENVDAAIAEVFYEIPPAYRVHPITICNRKTFETAVVLTIRCPKCRTPVLENEEWMMTDVPNVYEHVDCHFPGRT